MFAIAIPFLTSILSTASMHGRSSRLHYGGGWAITLLVVSSTNGWRFCALHHFGAFLLCIFQAGELLVGAHPSRILASIGVNALLTVPLLGSFAQSTCRSGSCSWVGRPPSPGCGASAKNPDRLGAYLATVCGILAFILLVVGSLTTYGSLSPDRWRPDIDLFRSAAQERGFYEIGNY